MKNIFAPTVLLLDETAASGAHTRLWLEKRGYNVKQVNCVTEAIENTIDFTLASRPSLILLDYGLMSEFSAEKLRLLQEVSDSGDVPLVALSDSGENFIGDKLLTVENLEALQPLLPNLLNRNYAKAA